MRPGYRIAIGLAAVIGGLLTLGAPARPLLGISAVVVGMFWLVLSADI